MLIKSQTGDVLCYIVQVDMPGRGAEAAVVFSVVALVSGCSDNTNKTQSINYPQSIMSWCDISPSGNFTSRQGDCLGQKVNTHNIFLWFEILKQAFIVVCCYNISSTNKNSISSWYNYTGELYNKTNISFSQGTALTICSTALHWIFLFQVKDIYNYSN